MQFRQWTSAADSTPMVLGQATRSVPGDFIIRGYCRLLQSMTKVSIRYSLRALVIVVVIVPPLIGGGAVTICQRIQAWRCEARVTSQKTPGLKVFQRSVPLDWVDSVLSAVMPSEFTSRVYRLEVRRSRYSPKGELDREVLTSFKYLSEVSCYGYDMSEETWDAIAGSGRLQSVSWNRGSICPKALRALAACRSLSTLDLGGSTVHDGWADELNAMERLCDLKCPLNTRVGDLMRIDRPERLQNLVLDNTSADDEWLPTLRRFRQLKTLSLADTAVTGVTADSLGDLHSLSVLVVNGAPISDGGILRIIRLTTLRRLCLDCREQDDQWAVALSSLPRLEELYGVNGGITDAGMMALLNSGSHIRCLVFVDRKISDQDVRHLAACNALREVCVEGTVDDVSAVNELRRLRPTLVISSR